jgi:hypothetical protein
MMFSGLPQALNLLWSMDVSLHSSYVKCNISDYCLPPFCTSVP